MLKRYVIDQSFQKHLRFLSGSAVKLYMALRPYGNLNSQTCFPTRKTLMTEAGIGEAHTFSKALKQLNEKGIVKSWLAPIANGKGRKLYFRILLDGDNHHLPVCNGKKSLGAVYSGENHHKERDQRDERSEKTDLLLRETKNELSEALIKRASKEFGEPIVLTALERMKKYAARHPAGYFLKICRSLHRDKTDAQNANDKRRRQSEINQIANGPLQKILDSIGRKQTAEQNPQNFEYARNLTLQWMRRQSDAHLPAHEWETRWKPRLRSYLSNNTFVPQDLLKVLPKWAREFEIDRDSSDEPR